MAETVERGQRLVAFHEVKHRSVMAQFVYVNGFRQYSPATAPADLPHYTHWPEAGAPSALLERLAYALDGALWANSALADYAYAPDSPDLYTTIVEMTLRLPPALRELPFRLAWHVRFRFWLQSRFWWLLWRL